MGVGGLCLSMPTVLDAETALSGPAATPFAVAESFAFLLGFEPHATAVLRFRTQISFCRAMDSQGWRPPRSGERAGAPREDVIPSTTLGGSGVDARLMIS